MLKNKLPILIVSLLIATGCSYKAIRGGAVVDGYDLAAIDLPIEEMARIGYLVKPMDIVLVRTGRDAYYSQPDYIFRGCGDTAGATRWLYEQGIRVMGIDAWGWDQPLDYQAKEALGNGRPGVFWAAHQVDLPYAHMERLVNLGALPSHGFKVSCFPLRIEGGSGLPCRFII